MALALWAILGPAGARGQDAGGPIITYSRHTTFQVPFRIDQLDRRVRTVLLHVSEDLGRTYQQVGTAEPAARGFRFQARHDGWYWFAVQTRDQEGRLYPPNLYQVQPGLKVCIDTKPPLVTLRPAQPREGTAAVEWDVSDVNLDLNTLRLDYRPAGGRDWALLAAPALARGQQSWDARGGGPVEVRLQVMDKARNAAEATTTVTPGAHRPGPGPAPAAGATEGARGKVVHVHSLTFQLNYEFDNVGPSQVKTVEIWWARDKHRWQKYPDSASPKGPYPVRVQEEGSYGFTLIPRSGVGLAARPPEPGDEPQIWVEVDTTKPVVAVHSAAVSPETGKLTVAWSARDRWLRARQPISISYAAAKEGPWLPLPGAGALDNIGTCTVDTAGLPWQVYLRVSATDEAGNVGTDVFRDPVKIDLKVPVIRSINVSVADPSPPGPPR